MRPIRIWILRWWRRERIPKIESFTFSAPGVVLGVIDSRPSLGGLVFRSRRAGLFLIAALLALAVSFILILVILSGALLDWPDWMAPVVYASGALLLLCAAPPLILVRHILDLRALSRRGIEVTAKQTGLRQEMHTLNELLSDAGPLFREWCGYYSYDYGGRHWTVRTCSAVKTFADLGEKAVVYLDPDRPERRLLLRSAS